MYFKFDISFLLMYVLFSWVMFYIAVNVIIVESNFLKFLFLISFRTCPENICFFLNLNFLNSYSMINITLNELIVKLN